MRYLYVLLAFVLIVSCSNHANKTDAESQVLSNSDAEKIRRTIDKHKYEIDVLYSKRLRKEPELKGALEFRLVIDRSGKVVTVEVIRSELSGLEEDVKAILEGIQFPAFDSNLKLNYIFEFFPN